MTIPPFPTSSRTVGSRVRAIPRGPNRRDADALWAAELPVRSFTSCHYSRNRDAPRRSDATVQFWTTFPTSLPRPGIRAVASVEVERFYLSTPYPLATIWPHVFWRYTSDLAVKGASVQGL